jgi:hypothetical protein
VGSWTHSPEQETYLGVWRTEHTGLISASHRDLVLPAQGMKSVVLGTDSPDALALLGHKLAGGVFHGHNLALGSPAQE